MVVSLIAMEDFLDGSIAPAAGTVGFPSRRGETCREFLSNTVLLDDVDDDDEGGNGVVATEDAMRAMSVVVTAVRDNAIVALLGRLRPLSPPGFLFLADALVCAPRSSMTSSCWDRDLERCGQRCRGLGALDQRQDGSQRSTVSSTSRHRSGGTCHISIPLSSYPCQFMILLRQTQRDSARKKIPKVDLF